MKAFGATALILQTLLLAACNERVTSHYETRSEAVRRRVPLRAEGGKGVSRQTLRDGCRRNIRRRSSLLSGARLPSIRFLQFKFTVELPRRPRQGTLQILDGIEQELRRNLEETEDQCPNGPLYFEPLARALALRVLGAVRDKKKRTSVQRPHANQQAPRCRGRCISKSLSRTPTPQSAAWAGISRSDAKSASGRCSAWSSSKPSMTLHQASR